MVRFVHGSRVVGDRVMESVPREGEVVSLDDESAMVVWNVGWHLPDGGEQIACVALRTRAEWGRAVLGRDDLRRAAAR